MRALVLGDMCSNMYKKINNELTKTGFEVRTIDAPLFVRLLECIKRTVDECDVVFYLISAHEMPLAETIFVWMAENAAEKEVIHVFDNPGSGSIKKATSRIRYLARHGCGKNTNPKTAGTL